MLLYGCNLSDKAEAEDEAVAAKFISVDGTFSRNRLHEDAEYSCKKEIIY